MKLLLIPELNFPFIFFCIFCLSILILIWYYLFYFARLSFHKQNSESGPTESLSELPNLPPASVIICAKNEDHNLPEFLPLILSQDYPEYEVIVVDDCSWDNTTDVLREFEKKHKHLKVITIKEDEKHPHGKKFAVMVGIKGAKYEHLLFTDADCKPLNSKWLEKMMRNFSRHLSKGSMAVQDEIEIVLGYSKYEKNSGFLNKLIRFDTFMIALQYFSFTMAGAPYMGVGRNLAYKKSLFFRHKGFASHYHIESGDDDLFINEASTGKNTSVEISKDSFTVSRVKKDWKGWIEQKRRHLTTWKEYKTSDKMRLGIYPASQVFFWFSFFILIIFQAGQWLDPGASGKANIFSEYDLYVVLGLFILKTITQLVIFKLAMDKLKEKDLFLTSLLAELFLLGFYPALTVSNALFRRKKWKTI